MELRHLRYFVAVAEEEHMTRAAKRVGIKQPPLSQQIQQLEQEVGVQLFDRKPRSIKLSAAGRVFLSDVRRILAITDDAIERVREFSRGREGTLRLGMTNSSSMNPRTLQLIRQFKETYPLTGVRLTEGTNMDLIEMLQQEHLDLAFLRTRPGEDLRLLYQELEQEEMMVCLPATHPLAARAELSIADLQHQSFIRYRQVTGPGIWERFARIARERGFEPVVSEDTERTLTAIHLVGAGLGLTVVPQSLASILPQVVSYRPLVAEDRFTVPLAIVLREGASAQPILRFLDLVRTETRGP